MGVCLVGGPLEPLNEQALVKIKRVEAQAGSLGPAEMVYWCGQHRQAGRSLMYTAYSGHAEALRDSACAIHTL